MARLPRAHEPGTKFNYNTGETDLVGILVSKAVGKRLSDYASEKLWKPYGMERDAIWMTDPAGHERGGCCMSMTLRDYGRLGQFMLDGGKAAGSRSCRRAGSPRPPRPRSPTERAGGLRLFLVDRPGGLRGSGIFGQSITSIPDDRLVIVINAAWPTARAAT